MDTLIAFVVAAALTLFFLRRYFKSLKLRDEKAHAAAEKGKLFSEGPKAQHPHIDNNYCIGCATCTTVCPEGDVLAMLGGKAVIVQRFTARGTARTMADVHDILIVGAGPAGIAASLRAIQHKLKYITIERDEIGGTVAKYPRQKLVMTSPVEFPMYGKFKKTELSKENLLAFWDKVLHRADFKVRTGQKVDDIKRGEEGIFTVVTPTDQFRAYAVMLALGRTGTPRKLGVPGEDQGKVMYRLIEADHYVNKQVLVVGGGDSAVEAAMGLANQPGNKVTLCYRGEQFSRIKERNSKRIQECMRSGKIEVLFNTNPVEFKANSALLDVQGLKREVPNDFVWIFAGGVPPYDFLKKIGIRFGMRDQTQEASGEAKREVQERQALAKAGSASA